MAPGVGRPVVTRQTISRFTGHYRPDGIYMLLQEVPEIDRSLEYFIKHIIGRPQGLPLRRHDFQMGTGDRFDGVIERRDAGDARFIVRLDFGRR